MKKTFFRSICLTILGIFILGALQAQVNIPGNKTWTKTKITVNAKDNVVVQVAGNITLDPNVSCNADGMKIVSGPEPVILKGINRGALLAKVGKKGVPFLVGANGKFIAGTTGILYFGINDDNTKNNSSFFTATVTVNGTAK
jgi:hypothetical protein